MALQVLTDSTEFTINKFTEHINNSDIHVTADEKATWSEKDIFIATLTSAVTDGVTTYSCDKTFDEIKAASDEKKICLLHYNNMILTLSMCSPTFASFDCSIGMIAYRYQVNSNNVWSDFTYGLLPSVTSDDNGKILQVVDGNWTAVAIANANINE